MGVESSLRLHLERGALAGLLVTTFEKRDSEGDKQVAKVAVIVGQKLGTDDGQMRWFAF